MRCNTCGMESRRTDVCDFCGVKLSGAAPAPTPLTGAQPLAAPQPPPADLGVTQQIPQPPLGQTQAFMQPPIGQTQAFMQPPVGQTQAFAPQPPQPTRVSLTGEAVPVAPPSVVPLAAVGQAAPVPGVPQRRIYDPAANLPASAIAPSLAASMARSPDRPSVAARWELTLAIFLPVMALSVLAAKLHASATIWVQLIDYFFVGLALGASAAIPSYDDAFMDCAVVLLLCFLVGPFISLFLYLIVGAIKQELNAAIICLLAGNWVVNTIITAAAATGSPSVLGIFLIGLFNGYGFIGVVITFVGWLLSNFFRPINED